jgi:hypothetical protein
VEAACEHGEAEQHGSEDHPESELGAFGAEQARLPKERDAVGDGLHAGVVSGPKGYL